MAKILLNKTPESLSDCTFSVALTAYSWGELGPRCLLCGSVNKPLCRKEDAPNKFDFSGCPFCEVELKPWYN